MIMTRILKFQLEVTGNLNNENNLNAAVPVPCQCQWPGGPGTDFKFSRADSESETLPLAVRACEARACGTGTAVLPLQCLRPSACVLPRCPHALTLEFATRSSHHHCMCVPIAGTSVRPCRASRNFSTLAPLGTAAVVLLSQKELGAASPAATGHGTLRFWTPSPTLCLCPCTS